MYSQKTAYRLCVLLGFDPLRLYTTLRRGPGFIKSIWDYKHLSTADSLRVSWHHIYPILTDRESSAGTVKGHYFHQDIWAAKKIYDAKPVEHIDIGSRVDGFIAHLLVFRTVKVVDIRNLPDTIPGLTFIQADATNLDSFADNSVESISSLHAIEHFGLGRYGDPIDPAACSKAMRALARVLSPGGKLYFSVPIGKERLEFNAHRVFSTHTVLNAFTDLNLVSFAAVDDRGDFHSTADINAFDTSSFSCGMFEYTKR
jgi:SAM-dependent methyltransferase